MTPPIPSREELDRLLAIHHRPRGPITVDGTALARVKRWVAQERPAFRLVVKTGQSIELTAEELSGAFTELVEDDRIIRQRGRRLAIEADREVPERLQRLLQGVSGQAWQVLDGRRCRRCKSYKIQIAGNQKPPGWAIQCRNCDKSQSIVF